MSQTIIDSHCHIHDSEFFQDRGAELLQKANQNGVAKVIVIGTDERSTFEAIDFANKHQNVFCAVGSHPHESKHGVDYLKKVDFADSKIVAIGEIGLDYYYNHSEPEVQKQILIEQIKIALAHDLPIVFHVREAFDDLWPILDQFEGQNLRGVIHSFTDNQENLEEALRRGFYVGVNGIATFTKDEAQLAVFKQIPLNRLLLETDAPFLTPKPYRGKENQPAYVKQVAEFLAELYQVDYDQLAKQTTKNCQDLFGV